MSSMFRIRASSGSTCRESTMTQGMTTYSSRKDSCPSVSAERRPSLERTKPTPISRKRVTTCPATTIRLWKISHIPRTSHLYRDFSPGEKTQYFYYSLPGVGMQGPGPALWRGSGQRRAGGEKSPPAQRVQKSQSKSTRLNWGGGARGGGRPPRMESNAPQCLAVQGLRRAARGRLRCRASQT